MISYGPMDRHTLLYTQGQKNVSPSLPFSQVNIVQEVTVADQHIKYSSTHVKNNPGGLPLFCWAWEAGNKVEGKICINNLQVNVLLSHYVILFAIIRSLVWRPPPAVTVCLSDFPHHRAKCGTAVNSPTLGLGAALRKIWCWASWRKQHKPFVQSHYATWLNAWIYSTGHCAVFSFSV